MSQLLLLLIFSINGDTGNDLELQSRIPLVTEALALGERYLLQQITAWLHKRARGVEQEGQMAPDETGGEVFSVSTAARIANDARVKFPRCSSRLRAEPEKIRATRV